ncbi:MAG: FAD-dependent oxidoreductase [Rhodospirillaceae bacterium]|nr:FAD-dependent oxidoreductase [Rhodospirillaceae bacterium]
MARRGLESLNGQDFDTIVMGGGVVGASAAQHLAAEGYAVLLVDKGDFGSGSSSRSGRLLHCGLRYMEPGEGRPYVVAGNSPVLKFMSDPKMFLSGCRRAREAMTCRAQVVRTMRPRLSPEKFYVPVWEGGKYKPWHLSAAFGMLKLLGPKDVPLESRRYKRSEFMDQPLVRNLRDTEKLTGLASYQEYRFEWPERICLDTVLDAERLGAVVRNHTPVQGLEREADGNWAVTIADSAGESGIATARAPLVLNTTGMWIDRVNELAANGVKRRVTGTKGTHLMVKLPEECCGQGVIAEFRDGIPFYIYPWRNMHYIGPTDTLFEGDEDEVRATDDEIDYLLDEANHLMPGLGGLTRSDLCFTWAGVRPQTTDPGDSMGARGRRIHDLAEDGMPGVLALTGGNIITHRLSGRDLCAAVKARLSPSGSPAPLSYDAKPFAPAAESPSLLNHWDGARLAHLRQAAEREHPVNLADLLFRRVGAGWTETMAREGAHKAAETVADILGWDEARIEKEVADYAHVLERLHRVGRGPDCVTDPMAPASGQRAG